MRQKLVMLAVVLGVASGAVLLPGVAMASYPMGMWMRIDTIFTNLKVTPMILRVDGTFVAGKNLGTAYKGYVYYACPAGKEDVCKLEWVDLAKHVGTKDCMGIGSNSAPAGTIHAPGEECAAEEYPIAMGVQVGYTPCNSMDEGTPADAPKTCVAAVDAGAAPDAEAVDAGSASDASQTVDATEAKPDAGLPEDVAQAKDVPTAIDAGKPSATDAATADGQSPQSDTATSGADVADAGTISMPDSGQTTKPVATAAKSSGCDAGGAGNPAGLLGLLLTFAGVAVMRRRAV